MTLWAKEKILWIMYIVTIILHVDVWAWDRIQPIIGGNMFPYHFWWSTLLFILLIAIYGWWTYKWEDFSDDIVKLADEYQQKTKQGGGSK